MTSKRAAAFLAVLVLVAVAAESGRAGVIPAWSYVPAPLRAKLAASARGSLFLPARTPLFYRYRSGAKLVDGTLSVPFTNRVRVRKGLWRWTRQTFLWTVQPLGGATACSTWKASDKIMQLSGNKVFWSSSEGTAWRCVTDRNGRPLVLSATAPGAPGDVGLGSVVASGLNVAGRASGISVSLTVKPMRIRQGGTVLVRGVAAGCPDRDGVTILSRAFSPVHAFAGVPAVYASVGSAGRFSTTARIPHTRHPGTYVITARCGGGNLGVSAHLTVTA
jgi:hypothetical protein